MHKNIRKFIKWLPALIWAIIIFTLSAQPDLSSGLEQDFILRKIAHAVVFGILAAFIYYGLISTRVFRYSELHHAHSFFRDLIITFTITIFYALSDEYHQTLVAGRTGNPVDVGIDILGILIILGAIAWLNRQRLLTEWKLWHKKNITNQVY